MNIVYAGTPDFAVAPLKALVESGAKVVAVITQQDKPQGRKGIITPSPVKVYAESVGLPVFQPKKIREEVEAVKALCGDVMITCAFGQILSREVLNCFEKGVWNIHASLLPKYRGASPIQWSVINGEKYTGITVMKTEEGLDTGDILLVKRLEILPLETAGELAQRLSLLGAEAIVEGLKYIAEDEPQLLLQDNAQATLVKKIQKEQAKIDFSKNNVTVANLIHGMNPDPVAYCTLDGNGVNIYKVTPVDHEGDEPVGTVLNYKKPTVKCGKGAVRIEELQLAGGKKISGADAFNGRKIQKGQILQ